LHALAQSLKLISVVKKSLNKITVPVLIIHSKEDHTTKAKGSEYLLKKIRSKKKKLVMLEESGHIISADVEKEMVFKEIEGFL